ncbi:hypothetical protein HPB52_011945 [Rhipicephalus sanguineus]|uniref:Uncharacterized protein n=1 Tax=Rhipicephalus sanguineus TaxID=34632 RepID=A0A9D4SQP1_RHISA|nr:hypothetical protein HPB52_011945 [Rhipicephalus sanguineus]
MSHGEGHDAPAAIQWKGQLDLDRPCGAVGSDETCWLCEDFPAWNTVIHALDLELAETAPGTLRLRFDPDGYQDRDFELDLKCAISNCTPAAQPSFPIFMRRQPSSPASRSFRLLRISESGSLIYLACKENAGAHLELRDIDAVIGLETLDIDIRRFGQCFAAEIDALLERNRNTLKSVEIFEARPGLNKLRMVEHLEACKSLAVGSLDQCDAAAPDVDGMVSLLRGSTTLKEATVKSIEPRQVVLVARALETNCCLTKLSLHVRTSDSIEELFGALEVNKHLKELFLKYCLRVNMTCARSVASALKKNDRLRTLDMATVILGEGVGLGLWSEALSKNVALHVFHMRCYEIPISEVSTLCKALQVNKSLKALKLPEVRGSEEESSSLARQLLEDECYDRVQLGPWTEPYLRVLAPVLASSEACTSELCLRDICQLSHENVSGLFNALSSTKKVKHLDVAVWNEPDHGVALLCETLKSNRSIQFLRIQMGNCNSANEILRALSVNTTITELDMTFYGAALEEAMTAFSDMLSRNNAITNIKVRFDADDPRRFLEAYAQGMSDNRLIFDLDYCVRADACIPASLFAPVRRNRAALNRAMDFVLQRREDRHCAECFELFFGRSCLITNLMEIGKMSDVEARRGVASAENRRREKYLVLTGVVRSSLACWPADVTQIDALNWDCWCAIACYLKVTDISS